MTSPLRSTNPGEWEFEHGGVTWTVAIASSTGDVRVYTPSGDAMYPYLLRGRYAVLPGKHPRMVVEKVYRDITGVATDQVLKGR